MDIKFNNKIFITNNKSNIKSFFKIYEYFIFCNILLNKVNILLNKVILLILMLKILM